MRPEDVANHNWRRTCIRLQRIDGRHFATLFAYAFALRNNRRHDVQQDECVPLAHHRWRLFPIDFGFTPRNRPICCFQRGGNIHNSLSKRFGPIRNGKRSQSGSRVGYSRSCSQLGKSTSKQECCLYLWKWVHGAFGRQFGIDLQACQVGVCWDHWHFPRSNHSFGWRLSSTYLPQEQNWVRKVGKDSRFPDWKTIQEKAAQDHQVARSKQNPNVLDEQPTRHLRRGHRALVGRRQPEHQEPSGVIKLRSILPGHGGGQLLRGELRELPDLDGPAQPAHRPQHWRLLEQRERPRGWSVSLERDQQPIHPPHENLDQVKFLCREAVEQGEHWVQALVLWQVDGPWEVDEQKGDTDGAGHLPAVWDPSRVLLIDCFVVLFDCLIV